jgi:CMP-N-acetylneuraminic acid synthetase
LYLKLLEYSYRKQLFVFGCVENNKEKYKELSDEINEHYTIKLNTQPTNKIQDKCFAGGFFILTSDLIDNFTKLYDEKLMYYFMNNFKIKDDQTILMDIIFTNPSKFIIHWEDNKFYDNWFMFQRLLL